MTISAGNAPTPGAPDLTPLLAPRSVAIIGASANPGAIGGRPLANLRRFGYTGQIHLVSRSNEEVDGIACVRSASNLPRDIDVALFVIPQSSVEDVLEECIERRVRSIILFSAGFAETGPEGARLQARIAARAREAGIALCGPNGLGLINHRQSTPLTFGWIEPAPLSDKPAVAIISQSGAVGMAMTYAAQSRGIALAYTISSGNEAALGLNDYLRHALEDPGIAAIALFAEQIRDPQQFLALCERAALLRKPLVLMKLGRSERARQAAQSHTGALVGDFARIGATLRARGVIMVDSMDELLDVAGLLARTPATPACGIAVMSDSGALVSVALDAAEPMGIEFPQPRPDTAARLREQLPQFVQTSNPVDMTTQGMNDPALFGRVAEMLVADPTFGALAIFAMPGAAEHALARVNSLLQILKAAGKPVAYTVLGGDAGVAAVKLLQENGISAFRTPDAALKTLSHVMHYAAWLGARSPAAPARAPAAAALAPGVMPEYRAKALLAARGFPIPQGSLATDLAQLRDVAGRHRFPLALKVQSPELMHKTEVGGVALGLADLASLEAAYTAMLERVRAARPDVRPDGVLVESMAAPGIEMAIGVRNDAEWGPMVMVALGGIWIEVLHDAALIAVPFDAAGARRALASLRAFALLNGARGAAPADIEALVALIVATGQLAAEHPEITEIDLNPVLVHAAGQGVTVVDASIVAGPV